MCHDINLYFNHIQTTSIICNISKFGKKVNKILLSITLNFLRTLRFYNIRELTKQTRAQTRGRFRCLFLGGRAQTDTGTYHLSFLHRQWDGGTVILSASEGSHDIKNDDEQSSFFVVCPADMGTADCVKTLTDLI